MFLYNFILWTTSQDNDDIDNNCITLWNTLILSKMHYCRVRYHNNIIIDVHTSNPVIPVKMIYEFEAHNPQPRHVVY